MLRYMIICSTLLMTAVTVRAQCQRPDVGENRILTEDRQTFPNGSTVTFECSTGYIPVETSASTSITCTGTQWSDLELQCKKKSCGYPDKILYGKYIYQHTEPILLGATITAKCNKGYLLVGEPVRHCRDDGWDGRAPVCEAVKCSKPPGITDGTFVPVYDSYDYGEEVTYICMGDLDLIGPSVLTCSDDGTFQPSPPQCQFVSCEKPEIPNAVIIEGTSPPYKYNSFVRYQCNKGYRTSGSDYLTCKKDGWNPPSPQCNVITCSKPPAIKNGTFNPQKELYQYGETVTCSCDEGFILSGASTISCTDDGKFESPQCLKTCDRPQFEHGYVDSKAKYFIYNSSVRVKCNNGYKMEGSDYLTCEDNGWNPPPPQCHLKTCDRPQIKNGYVDCSSHLFVYKSSVLVYCNIGYKREGSDFLSCGDNRWNPPPPKCHLDRWIWIIPIIVGAVVCVLVCGGCCCCCWKKKKHKKKCKVANYQGESHNAIESPDQLCVL
ncbi:hypothetical protein AMELA_G00201140 [Ameiurus melas]|uniref:Sushi domain-containing protein n=1 Tax=Ameiurus melas TaxID=219545 RepID=A0A7J6A797_AMEME|nr:hypothetical protein AMELA_G00201140 [Ameiurus melas]